MSARMTAEQRERIRAWIESSADALNSGALMHRNERETTLCAVALLAELDAVTRERDEARETLDDLNPRYDKAIEDVTLYAHNLLVCQGQRDAETARLDWLDEDGFGTNWLRLRTGRNRIGVAVGGWLLTEGRIGEGPESHHIDLRSAIDAGRGVTSPTEAP